MNKQKKGNKMKFYIDSVQYGDGYSAKEGWPTTFLQNYQDDFKQFNLTQHQDELGNVFLTIDVDSISNLEKLTCLGYEYIIEPKDNDNHQWFGPAGNLPAIKIYDDYVE